MNRTYTAKFFFVIVLPLGILLILTGCLQKINSGTGEELDEYDGPDKAFEFEFNRTKDPATGNIPRDHLLRAMEYTDSLKAILPFQLIAGYGNWTERGPNSDAVGISNSNTRANSGITSGRIRAVLVDANDGTGNTVWVGAVAGGLWKTTDITASIPTWTFSNDFFSNMAISGICQDPTTPATMYFCTGESFFNSDAVTGDGVWKSTNSGATWTQLASTTGASFDNCTKILCDASGNLYVTSRSGVFRSTNGGTNWTTITPSGLSTSRFSDMEISSTGRLHVSAGIFSTCAYRFTDNPSTVTTGTWTSPTSGYPASSVRIELGCNGNTLYALPSNASSQVPTIYKSIDGGANWAATAAQPTAGWASGQAWYALAVDIDGSGNVIVGGLDPYKSTDGGATWTKLSDWTSNAGLPPTTTEYVHADIHFIKMYGSNRVLFASDGGIFYSSNSGSTIRDRNTGLRIKQFFSCAIHPSTTNYFLAGAQDNGCHKFTSAGLGSTTEVTGGDGAFVAIDQTNASNQFGSYVYNHYRRSTNGGTTWSSIDYYVGGSTDFGQFINPWDYDNANDNLYASGEDGKYVQWLSAPTTSSITEISVALFNSNGVSAVKVSPYTSNTVYFGTDHAAANCRIVKATNANNASPTFTNITGAISISSTVSCINTGTDDQHLICSFSNYGVQHVWVSTDGGTNWTNIDGDLPDMPVRWCMFVPGSNNTRALLATEAGVYLTLTINGGSTAWIPSSTFPTVRTDMLAYRSSDGLIAAATHGRGLWTQPYYSVVPTNNFLLKGKWQSNTTVELTWEYDGLNPATSMDIEESTDALHFYKVGSVAYNGKNYSFIHSPGQKNVYYRIKSNETTGNDRYSNSIALFKTAAANELTLQRIFPDPVQNDITVAFNLSAKARVTYLVTNISGQTVTKKEEYLQYTGAYNKTWSMRGLPAGVYTLTLVCGNEKRSQKFIKQ